MTIHTGTLLVLPAHVRTVVMVGKKSSDHLRELIRIAEFKGRIAYRIEQASDLQPRWFVGVDEVGLIVGADDLQSVVRAIVDRLNAFARADIQGMLEGAAK